MSRRLIVGNWKMNGSLQFNQTLIDNLIHGILHTISDVEIVICPPFPYLAQVSKLLKEAQESQFNKLCELSLGAQDVSAFTSGAYTGDVSSDMLCDFFCKWVIVGHSERRLHHGESSELVALKAKSAVMSSLKPIVCVGETLDQRQSGLTLQVISSQLQPFLALGLDVLQSIVFAYEPVWAIGTGFMPTSEQIAEVHTHIYNVLQGAYINCEPKSDVTILYGGSVKPDNAEQIFGIEHVGGVLVGGASLNASDFLNIARVAI